MLDAVGALRVPLVAYLSLAVAVIGVGLMVGARWGRARWLIVPGLLLVPFVLTASLIVVVNERRPTITAISRQSGGITRLDCLGVPSRTYTVQACPNLANPTNWVNIGGITATPNGTFTTYDMAPPNAAQRFYRLHSP